jgi:cytochrome c553
MIKVMIAVAAMAVVSVPALAGDAEAGKKKATEVCAACHGPDGNSPTPDFPRLAGQHPDYLEKALGDYKSGRRDNPIMKGMATGLSDADIANVAAYFSSQRGLVQH